MKDLILPSLAALLIVGGIIVFGTVAKPQPAKISPYDNNAKVMYFYSDLCSWCQKEKIVLDDLAKDGYRVKPMDVKAHPEYWQEYQVEGTPTFLAPDGQRLAGYQEKEKLKEFLDKYK